MITQSNYGLNYRLPPQDALRLEAELERKLNETKRQAKSIGDCVAEFMDQRALKVLKEPTMQKTIKEFKAFIGTRPTLELVEFERFVLTTESWVVANHRFKKVPRRVVETNTVGFVFEGGSEMNWPTREELNWDGGKKFIIITEHLRLTYEVK